jgi:hypothetical protein
VVLGAQWKGRQRQRRDPCSHTSGRLVGDAPSLAYVFGERVEVVVRSRSRLHLLLLELAIEVLVERGCCAHHGRRGRHCLARRGVDQQQFLFYSDSAHGRSLA